MASLQSTTVNGILTVNLSSGTMISSSAMTDMIGWNASYGSYIGSTVGSTTYIYGNGSFYDGSVNRTLLHAGNYGGYSTFTGSVTSGYGSFASPGYLIGDAQYGFYVTGGSLYYKSASSGVHYWRNIANSANTMSLDNSGNLLTTGNIATGVTSNLQPLSAGSSSATTLGLLRTGISAVDGGVGPSINFYLAQSTSSSLTGDTNLARITANPIDSWGGRLLFFTKTADGNNTTAPTEKMRLTEAGNLGIGTTSPAAKLQIGTGTPTSATDGIQFGSDTSARLYRSGSGIIQSSGGFVSSSYLYSTTFLQAGNNNIYPNGYTNTLILNSGNSAGNSWVTTLAIAPGGNVGIEVTSPTAKLDIAGSNTNGYSLLLRSGDALNGTDSVQIGFGYNNTTDYRHSIRTRHNSAASAGNNIDFYLWKYGTDSASTLGSQFVMTLQGNGNVGIGVTSPTALLDVVTATASSTALSVRGTNGTLLSVVDDLSDSLLSVNNSAGLPVLEVFADDRVVMGQYGQNDLVVRNNKVGIGVLNPAQKLEVNSATATVGFGARIGETRIGTWIGNTGYAFFAHQSVADTSGSYSLIQGSDGTSFLNSASTRNLYFRIGNSDRMMLNSSGNLGIGTTSPATALQIGELTPTSATAGLQFGDDTGTRIYRSASSTLTMSGTFIATTFSGSLNGNASTVTNGVYTNVNNTLTGVNIIQNTANTFVNTVATANQALTLLQGTAGADAYITFHVSGDYAGYFGLGGAENDLVWGGWSVGNNRYRILHSGNQSYAWALNQLLRTTDSPTFSGLTLTSLTTPGLPAQWTLSGGGTVTWDGSNILWGTRVIAIPVEKTEFTQEGYVDINCPTSGTITYYNSSNVTTTVTCTAAGIPIGIWEALYYEVTPGQNNTFDQTKFRLVAYPNSTWKPTSNWLLICARNGDSSNGHIKWIPGQVNLPNSSGIYYTGTGLNNWQANGTTNYVSKFTGANVLGNSQIQDNGTNVGIGTSPAYKLDVNGTIHYTTLTASSDARFKKNIEVINNPLSKLSSVRGVRFEWNEFVNSRRDGYELNKPTFGVIAQELENVFPELVSHWKLSDDCSDARSVNYEKLIPVLIEAIKELNNKNSILEARILALENK